MSDRITANLPSRDFDATIAFYGRLGFVPAYRDAHWLILERGPLELESSPIPILIRPAAAFPPASGWMIWPSFLTISALPAYPAMASRGWNPFAQSLMTCSCLRWLIPMAACCAGWAK